MKGAHYCDEWLTTGVPYVSGQYLNSSTPHVSLTFARLYLLYQLWNKVFVFPALFTGTKGWKVTISNFHLRLPASGRGIPDSTSFMVNMSNDKDAPKSTVQIWSGESFYSGFNKGLVTSPGQRFNRVKLCVYHIWTGDEHDRQGQSCRAQLLLFKNELTIDLFCFSPYICFIFILCTGLNGL